MTKQHLMLCFEYLFQPSQFTKFKDYFSSTVVWLWQVYDTYLRYLYLTNDKAHNICAIWNDGKG